MGKTISGIDQRVFDQLMHYAWPGNIRELEHVIERSLVLAKDEVLSHVYLPDTKLISVPVQAPVEFVVKTIEENERDHIINVLRFCKGKVGGYKGAAEFLGVPPSTLSSKLKRLGIGKHYMGGREQASA
jgi:transcriptional regulator with GAF, ATPase, and Fis domain